MAQINLKPEDDLSKVEEIALLEKIVSNLHEGSYLRLMLNDKLVDWLKHQIHEDAGCDVWLNWQEVEAQRSNAEQRAIEARKAQEKAEESLEHAKQFGEGYLKQIETLHIEVQAGKDHIQALQWKVQEVEENREFVRDTKDAQINALKVEVYDLLHSKK
jgi:hypothetical protein